MNFKDRLKESFKETFIGRNFNETIFVKEFSKENQLLVDMENLLAKNPNNELLKKDIMLLKYGLIGEEKVAFELKNSQIPMFILHDIRLEYDGLVAQFDFIVITGQHIYCIETKNLSGDMEIDSEGSFYRLFKNKYGKIVKKEGMYSPITQNERHINILRKMLLDNKIIKTYPIKSLIVVANEKTVIDKSKAPKEVINQLYKADNLIKTIKIEDEITFKKNDKVNKLVAVMKEVADFILEHNTPIRYNIEKKYLFEIEDTSYHNDIELSDTVAVQTTDNLISELKTYRLNKSKELNIKPYMVFSNDEMERLIEAYPLNKSQFLNVKGFKEKKYELYGEDIVSIFNKFK